MSRIEWKSVEDKYEAIGYLAKPGVIETIEATVPEDKLDKFKEEYKGKYSEEFPYVTKPKSKYGYQFRIYLSDTDGCPSCLVDCLSSKYDDEIKEYIDKINFFSIRRRFYRSRYMIDFSYLNVFLLACFRACNNNNKTLLNFLKILEKYLFSIEFYDGEAIEELCINLFNFAEAVVKLNKGEWVIQGIIDKLKKLYESLVNSTELNKKTVLYYSKNGFYRTSWLRYFLCEYEYSLMKKSKTNINKLNRWEIYERGYNSIEHIYPENSHNKYWIELFREYTSKQKNALKNSLGNFVAISSEKNGKLGNKSFPEKKSNTQNPVGYKYGTYAEIEIADYKDWDSMAILKRGLMLIAFLNERWGIRVGNGKKDDKYKFLGLQFLI